MSRLILFILILLPVSVFAHKPSDSYLFFSEHKGKIMLQWDIALRDLDYLIGLDNNRDSKITWSELKHAEERIFARAASHIIVESGEKGCSLEKKGLRTNRHSDGGYATLDIGINCQANNSQLKIIYSLLFEQDPDHRGVLVDNRGDGKSTPVVLSPGSATTIIDHANSRLWLTFYEYFKQGIWHIWIGFDHILFIVTLLLPAVLVLRNHGWVANTNFHQAGLALVKVVTAFTLAHSITLSMAVTGIITVPTRLVESMIAFSIIVVAFNNLKPVFHNARWVLAFGFGLIHGFGFASVLLDLGLSGNSLITSLLAFNLGVEFGQIAILLLIFPLAWLLRDSFFYRGVILRGGSVVVSLFAVVWLIERSSNIDVGFTMNWIK